MTGLTGTRLFCGTSVILEAAGLCRPKDGSLIRRSTHALRRTTLLERRIHFLPALRSVMRNSIMAGVTYASASYGETGPSLKAVLSRLAASFTMVMRRLSDTR